MHGLLRFAARALVALLLALAGVGVVPAPAHACRCVTRDVQQHAERADAVFTATVTTSAPDTVGTGRRERRVRRYTAEVDRFYQGGVPGSTVMITAPLEQSACGFGAIPAGEAWVFFVDGADTRFFGNSCGGSHPATGEYLARVERVLGTGQALVEPVPEAPPLDYDDVEIPDPVPLGKLLAPGGAVAIIGLLGLALVRRRSGAS